MRQSAVALLKMFGTLPASSYANPLAFRVLHQRTSTSDKYMTGPGGLPLRTKTGESGPLLGSSSVARFLHLATHETAESIPTQVVWGVSSAALRSSNRGWHTRRGRRLCTAKSNRWRIFGN